MISGKHPREILIFLLLFVVITAGFVSANVSFAQSQSSCSGSVNITDTSQSQPGVLLVVANSLQASFTITGPKTYSGSGGLLAEQNIPPGTYAVTWGSVAGCGTPPPETKTTDAKHSIIFFRK